MENSTIRYNNTRNLIDQAGGVAQFAEKVGKSAAQVSSFAKENGTPRKNIGNKIAREIERAFGKPIGWLDAPHYDPLPNIKSNVYKINEKTGVYDIRGNKVPLISWVKAGHWCESPDNFSPGDADEWIDCSFAHSYSTYALKVVGDSMLPEYREGEIIFVDPELAVHHGDDVVARTPDNTYTFKRIQITPDGTYLKAINPDFRGSIINIPDNTHICGVVIASQQDRRKKRK